MPVLSVVVLIAGILLGAACAGMLRFFQAAGNRRYGTKTRPLHDALAIGYVLWPELFIGRRCNVEVETGSTLTCGATVVDWGPPTRGTS